MKLVHVTDGANLPSIMESGLDPSLATGKRQAVWFLSPSLEGWGLVHTIAKPRAKGRTIQDHIVLEVNIPRSWLKRYRRGIWYCERVVPSSRIAVIKNGEHIAMNYPT